MCDNVTDATPMDVVLTRYLPVVETEVARALEGRNDSLLFQIIRYHLGLHQAGAPLRGKRIRPVLCLLACEAVGGSPELAAPAAAAIELVHAFTLIHDDVADQDELRRGRPTVWRRWGVGQAVTAGDALYSLAGLCLGHLDANRLRHDVICATHHELHEAVLALCEGQQLDISFEGRADVAVEDYLQMIGLKTGALLAAAAGIGALTGGADVETSNRLRRFGRQLGVCFQVCDDLLGIWGDPAQTGKPVGGDLLRRKRSLPVIHALSHAGGSHELLRRLTGGISTAEEAGAVAEEMEAVGSRVYCEQAAAEALDRALVALEPLALREPHSTHLRGLATLLADRTR
jgi:geranylgeranyl diphosphate synthase type I